MRKSIILTSFNILSFSIYTQLHTCIAIPLFNAMLQFIVCHPLPARLQQFINSSHLLENAHKLDDNFHLLLLENCGSRQNLEILKINQLRDSHLLIVNLTIYSDRIYARSASTSSTFYFCSRSLMTGTCAVKRHLG